MVGGISTLTGAATAATVLFVSATVDAFLDEYIRRYTAGDVRGVTNSATCRSLRSEEERRSTCPTAAPCGITSLRPSARIGVRRVLRHGTGSRPTPAQLGEQSVFASVHWNALDANEKVVRDTWTSYQLLGIPEGWQLLSYTNHF